MELDPVVLKSATARSIESIIETENQSYIERLLTQKVDHNRTNTVYKIFCYESFKIMNLLTYQLVQIKSNTFNNAII